jgi:hypothetical protein
MTLVQFWELALGHFGLRDSPLANGAIQARGATINSRQVITFEPEGW